MKKIYVAENPALVWSARLAVEAAGIPCTLRNEYAGGASGLLSPLDAWPELWVIDDRHLERAEAVLRTALAEADTATDWTCTVCGEVNADSFALCWQCGQSAPA